VVLATACGSGSEDGSPDDASQASPSSGELSACDVLTKEKVEQALGVGELTLVEDGDFDCAYGSEADEAQVTFSAGASLVGGSQTFEEGRTASKDVVGEEAVRDLDIGLGAYVVDNGDAFFATALVEGDRTISIYIYPAIRYNGGSTPISDIRTEQLFDAAESMLATAVPRIPAGG
jgi:hypothetical protein